MAGGYPGYPSDKEILGYDDSADDYVGSIGIDGAGDQVWRDGTGHLESADVGSRPPKVPTVDMGQSSAVDPTTGLAASTTETGESGARTSWDGQTLYAELRTGRTLSDTTDSSQGK